MGDVSAKVRLLTRRVEGLGSRALGVSSAGGWGCVGESLAAAVLTMSNCLVSNRWIAGSKLQSEDLTCRERLAMKQGSRSMSESYFMS